MDTINESDIHPTLKEGLLDRFDCVELEDIKDEGLIICELDTCLAFYEDKTGTSWRKPNGAEKDDVEITVKKEISKLKDFPVRIMTEDYIMLN